MSTRSAYRQRIRRLVRDLPHSDTLDAGIDNDDTSIKLSSGMYGGAPMIFEIVSTKELVYSPVYLVDTFSDCVRGHGGTTPAAALAGAQVLLGPRWSSLDIDDAINSAIERMSSLGLYRMKAMDVTYNASIQGYDLASDVIEVYEVRAKTSGPDKSWPEIDAYGLVHDLATSEFASTNALVLYGSGTPSLPLRVRYRARYGTFSDDTTDGTAATIGIQSFAADLPQLGAMAELMGGEETPRTQLQTAIESQRGADSPAQHARAAWQQLDARFRQRAAEALDHLDRLYPPRMVRQP